MKFTTQILEMTHFCAAIRCLVNRNNENFGDIFLTKSEIAFETHIRRTNQSRNKGRETYTDKVERLLSRSLASWCSL